jgi:tight adherence protein C
MTEFVLAASITGIVLGLAVAAFHIASNPMPPAKLRGRRGLKRRRALRHRALFRSVEPLIRSIGTGIEPLLPRNVAGRVERALLEAGYPLGLSAPELIASSMVGALATLALLFFVAHQRAGTFSPILVGALVVGALPFVRLSAVRRQRGNQVTRRLPAVLELVVMCLSAGLSLPRALRCVVESATDPFDPIVEELDTVVRELELGRTRREALEGLADRVPTAEVTELVNSVIQSEEKGVSLIRALAVQCRTLKLRRSMKAEQAASGAALMLMGPMSLIFLCVIALLLGPVLIRTTVGGFGA